MPQSHGSQLAKFTKGKRPVQTLLRSLVSAVIEHGQIETTVAKAKAAKKVLERVITAAKKGTPESFGRTSSWLHNHRVTMPVLHTTLRERYADRTGGYARIHLAGSRYGDKASMAILELVDSPGEIKFEMLARTLGRKIYEQELRTLKEVDVFDTQVLGNYANWHLNNDIRKALRLRPAEARDELRAKAEAHRDMLRAEESVYKTAGLQYDVRPPRDADKRFGSVALEDHVPEFKPKKPEGRFIRPGELLPAMAVKTPTKPVPFADRHLWARLPAKKGGRGGVPSDISRPDDAAFGAKLGQTGVVPGVDGVPADAQGWSTKVGGGNGEFPLGRSPINLARLALGKRRTPVRRFGRDGDGMGG